MKNVILLFAALVTWAALPVVAADAQATSQVYVVHAIDIGGGTPVDVCVGSDPTPLLTDFETTDVAGPLELPAADYDIAIYFAGVNDCTSPATALVVQDTLTVPGGANLSVVAYVEEAPDQALVPVLGAFVNDVSCLDAADARATARHTANAPAVDVTADGGDLFTDLSNGEQQVGVVPAGTYDLGVELASDGSPVLSLPATNLPALTNSVVYVIGGTDSPFSAFAQAIPVEECPVPTTTTTTTTTAPQPLPVSPAPVESAPATATSATPNLTG